jgi:trimeric autotransporter adhesin
MRMIRLTKTWNGATVSLAAFALILLAGCGKFFRDSNEIAGISVSPANASLQLNKTQQFTAIGTFGDSSDRDVSSSVEWTSSSPKVATIDSSGLATALSTGTTIITASEHNVSGSTTLTVSVNANGITVSPSSETISAGQTVQFTVTRNGSAVNGVTWSSSQTTVATIDQNGVATGKAAGTTTIIATATINGTQFQGTASLSVE